MKSTSQTLRQDAIRLVAVDPGDAWCGVAALEMRGPIYSAFSTVIHATPRTMYETITAIMRTTPTAVIVEKYQQRAVGHQKWAEPKAPRIIGALEYLTQENGQGFHTVNTGNPKDLERMPFWPIITEWRANWRHGNAANWSHGLSAWRILGSFMMQHRVFIDRLVALREQQRYILKNMYYQPVEWLGDMQTVSERDLVSTPLMWRMP
jgi:hypothetical protein